MNKLEKLRRVLELPNYPIKGSIKGLTKASKVLVYKGGFGVVKVNNCYWAFSLETERGMYYEDGPHYLEVHQVDIGFYTKDYLELDFIKTLAINKALGK